MTVDNQIKFYQRPLFHFTTSEFCGILQEFWSEFQLDLEVWNRAVTHPPVLDSDCKRYTDWSFLLWKWLISLKYSSLSVNCETGKKMALVSTCFNILLQTKLNASLRKGHEFFNNFWTNFRGDKELLKILSWWIILKNQNQFSRLKYVINSVQPLEFNEFDNVVHQMTKYK